MSSDGTIVDAWPMPTFSLSRGGKSKREIDVAALAHRLAVITALHAYVERVGAMPGQGSTSMFAFGKCYGIILGILGALDIPVTLVAPQRWKKALGVGAAKDSSRERASQLMPAHSELWMPRRGERNAVQAAGIAESALICEWGRRSLERAAA